MKNKTLEFKTITQLSKALEKISIRNEKGVLVQIFLADCNRDFIQELQNYFQKNFSQITLIGTTTDGIIKGDCVYFGKGIHIASVSEFEHTELKSTIIELGAGTQGSFKLGKKLAEAITDEKTKVLLTFSDGTYTNGEEFLKGISQNRDKMVVAGGMAADNGELIRTFIFDMHYFTDRGAVGVALSGDRLSCATNYTFDWEPIGKKLRVTKAVKNRVYEIDEMSAVDIYTKYLGAEVADKLPKIGIEFPLVLERDSVLVGRAVVAKYEDGSLGFAGNINEGEFVRFGVGAADEILNNSNYQLHKLLQKLQYQPEAVFVYSCMARRRFLQEHIEEELESLEPLGSVSGFFTYGEFFHQDNKNQLLNETMTVLVLSESREPLNITVSSSQLSEHKEEKLHTNHILARLANSVSRELEELNENLERRIEKSAEYIYKQAYFDKLTGLPNRLRLINRLESSYGETIFLINIDDFTTINDFYGHEVGDRVLVQLAQILKELSKEIDAQLYKLPSDEFVLLSHVPYNKKSIEGIIKRVIAEVSKSEFDVSGNFVHVSITMSAAYTNEKHNGLANADMALKMAKRSKKLFMIFDEDLELTKQYEQNIHIANSIRYALKNDGIIPYVQPIFSLTSGEIEKYEVLARLITEDGVILTPYAFLDVSEKIKLYPQITEIMIEKSFSFFAANGLSFSINLAFSDILNERTREYLFEKIIEYDIASQLTVEILETQEFESNEVITKFILDIYSYGAKIAIDDFGSGFANFKHMTTIESDYMKIDGSLIRDIVEDKNDRLVVETIVSFAKKLGKKTIAEFVHSKEVYEMVKNMGIDFAQGFYLAEPSPVVCED
jgi:diguanylate cyclase (GGDEF)-like protein